jgi:hypothetical protein
MTRRKPRVPKDPVVEEVRRWRAAMVRDAGGTLRGLMKLLDKRERVSKAELNPSRTRRAKTKPRRAA